MNHIEADYPDGRLRLANDVRLPDVLDVLVVGGGPAGTAVAFRAKELGLAALVIELDDLLKRIRDYDAAKPIKPDFGTAKQMGFPKGGPLIERLHFFTDIQGGDLCSAWKALYREHSVPAMLGVELVGLTPGDGGVWIAAVRNHRTDTDDVLHATHVVLALGAGMPRRLDVPGDVRAIGHRLSGTERYVGAPACVIGGGVSAAEAVIAISDAKASAADASAVFWSHRGREMPKVPRALEAALQRATSINGNVRFLAGSEAREVVATDAGKVLRIQFDRAGESGPPVETTLVEFDAARTIACIGQEIDWGLLNDIGIHQVTSGTRIRPAIPLNGLLESRQPNVYVIGDTLNTAYLECDDFDDPGAYREMKHRGNIKASLIDGVKVGEVIAQRLAGKSEIRVELEFVGGTAPQAPATPSASDDAVPVRPERAEPAGRLPREEPVAEGPAPAVLVRLIDREVEAEQFVLYTDRETTIGRRHCDICFDEDSRLADRHAAIVPGADGYRVRDEGSSDGVFLHLTEGRGRVVARGAVARMGRQWLVLGSTRDPLLIAHHDAQGRHVGRHRLSEGAQIIGRKAPDITLAGADMGLSRRHASVVVTGTQVFVRDLNSPNGIYLKVDGVLQLDEDDVIRVGHQALRFGLIETVVRSEVVSVESARVERPVPSPRPDAVAASTDGLTVTFQNLGRTCPFEEGQTLCDVAEVHGVTLSADCHSGICGSDPLRIVSGEDHLNPMTDAERETLEDICAVEPGRHRLACMSRARGPVTVEIVDQ